MILLMFAQRNGKDYGAHNINTYFSCVCLEWCNVKRNLLSCIKLDTNKETEISWIRQVAPTLLQSCTRLVLSTMLALTVNTIYLDLSFNCLTKNVINSIIIRMTSFKAN